MRFRRETVPPPTVRQGASYRRSRGADVIETARIIAVTDDPLGIPHVRFALRIAAGAGEIAEEQRTLALACFTTLYQEAIGA